jgi:phage terminase large subunit GpA-like protein
MTSTHKNYDLLIGFLYGMKPEPRLTVSEWADLHRYLSSTSSSEPGRWRTSRTPYLRKIQDYLSSASIVQEIILMKGAQLGLTEAGFNWIGYIIDIAPAPTLMVQPTDAMVKRASKMRFDPMIEATPRLRDKIKTARSRDSGNTMTQKDFPGGAVVLTGANSPVGLRSMPAKNVFMDEVDAYPNDLDGEGSPIALAKARTRTFPKKKIFVVSTPTIKGKSIIEKEFDTTDKQYYFVPCPHCGGEQTLIWDQMRWEPGKPDTVRYQCIHCNEMIEERYKTVMLEKGDWRATAPENINPIRVGFHINSLYSPYGWYSWADAVKDYETGEKDINEKKTFTNTVLGLTWQDEGEAPPWENIYNRRESYPTNTVNKDVCFLTAGVDIQKDRIELEIVGWCRGKRSYSIDYRVLLGKTEEQEVWEKLWKTLSETFMREDGCILPIQMTCIDHGYNSTYVYEFCKKHDNGRIVPVKGQERQSILVAPPRSVNYTHTGKKIGRVKLWNIGVSMMKQELYGWLRLEKAEDGTPPDGYCHFPQYAQHYFRGLTAEQLEFKIVKGFRKYEWVKKYERNEPLDCRNYARAAACIVGMDRFTPESWDEISGSFSQNQQEKKEKPKKKDSFWG